MALRLLLALLIALATFPAPAAAAPCHTPPAVHAMHAAHAPREAPPAPAAMADHCLGCIAPATIRAPALAPGVAPLAPLPLATDAGGIAGAAPLPATPPPRSAT